MDYKEYLNKDIVLRLNNQFIYYGRIAQQNPDGSYILQVGTVHSNAKTLQYQKGASIVRFTADEVKGIRLYELDSN